MSDNTFSPSTPSSSSLPFKMMGFLGRHGPYTFYRSIKTGDRTFSLSQFMPVKIWPDSAMLNIANIQLLWSDKTESFCSLKLYFLPENTPDGRLQQHGEDEVIALQDKVTIRAADLLSILVEKSEWDWGFKTPSVVSAPLSTALSKSFVSETLGDDKINGTTSITGSSSVVVLSYPRYTRLRSTLKRLECSPEIQRWLENPLVLAIGALNVGPNCRVLYAKESFDHPDLEDNEILCNHLAPKLKGRKGRKKRNHSQGSASNESASSSSCSVGSYKENEQKSFNGIKLETDENPDSRHPKESGKHRGSSSYNKHRNQKLWIKSEPGLGTKKGSNGISGVEQSVVVKMGGNGDWDSKCKAQLLGPALTELAQKLERSNALQILPIRPAAVSTEDENPDNHMPRKRRKTEYPIMNPLVLNRTGPYDCRSKSLAIGPPGDNRTKNLQGGPNSASSAIIEAHTIPIQISKLSRVGIDWKPLHLKGSSPCLFTPLDAIYSDPYDAKRNARYVQQGIEFRNLDILDFSQRKSRQDKGSASRSSSSLTIKNCINPDLLDLSHRLDHIPASTTMNQMGVRLTSEVTLFPSKYLPSYPSSLDGVMQHNFANPRHSANAALSNSKTIHEIDIQPWNPSSSSAGSSRTVTPTVKEQVTAKKHTKGAYDRTSQSQSHGPSKSSSSGRSTDRKELEKNSPAMSVQNPFMHPYFGKMDPAYLHFLANATPLFMPPPPPNFMAIPGAVEQFYKDFFMQTQGQGIPPGFPFPPGAGNDRGPNS